MRTRLLASLCLAAALSGSAGCSSGPSPESNAPPPAAPSSEGLGSLVVGGAGDSIESIPGRHDAPYYYRFRQIEPASDRFTFQDRDLSFHFKPTPDALHFQVENRQNRPVWIEWERSTFYDVNGGSDKVAHGTTRWEDRFKSQPSTQIAGLARYGDYVLPMGYLLDSGRGEQLHRPVLPEDSTSPQYTDRVFGVDLTMTIEDRPRVYTFRFKIASVIPH